MKPVCVFCGDGFDGARLKDKKALRVCKVCASSLLNGFEAQMRYQAITDLERIHALNTREIPTNRRICMESED